jgi:hypothetical protein
MRVACVSVTLVCKIGVGYFYWAKRCSAQMHAGEGRRGYDTLILGLVGQREGLNGVWMA